MAKHEITVCEARAHCSRVVQVEYAVRWLSTASLGGSSSGLLFGFPSASAACLAAESLTGDEDGMSPVVLTYHAVRRMTDQYGNAEEISL